MTFQIIFLAVYICLQSCWFASGVSIISNVRLPSKVENIVTEDDKKVYNFNFPKDGVFVFNNPTILNLNTATNTAKSLEDTYATPLSDDTRIDGLLCNFSKVQMK